MCSMRSGPACGCQRRPGVFPAPCMCSGCPLYPESPFYFFSAGLFFTDQDSTWYPLVIWLPGWTGRLVQGNKGDICLLLPKKILEELLERRDVCYYWLVHSGPRRDDRKCGVMHRIVSPAKRYVKVLMPNASESDLLWKQGLYKGDQVKMRLLGWALIQFDSVLIIRWKLDIETETYKENAMRRGRQRLGDASTSQGISKIATATRRKRPDDSLSSNV